MASTLSLKMGDVVVIVEGAFRKRNAAFSIYDLQALKFSLKSDTSRNNFMGRGT